MKLTAVFFILFFSFILNARENPFQPAQSLKSEPLSKPISSTVLEENEIEAVDEITTYKIVNNRPLSEKPVNEIYQEEVTVKKPIKEVIKSKPKARFHLVYRDENLKIYTKSNHIKIITKKIIQKHFALKLPYRIVFDFNDDFYIYNTLSKKITNRYLKEIRLGTHKYFYRLTFVLKQNCGYKIKKISNGYLIKLL